MHFRTRLRAVAAVLTLAAVTVQARADATFDQVRALNALLPCEELPPTTSVRESYLGPQRQVDRRDVRAARVFRVEGTCYVEEQTSRRWLVGHPAPGGGVLCEQSFATLDDLVRASAFAPLPKPPEGFTVREVARFPHAPTRVASDGTGDSLLALCNNGDVWRVDLKAGGPLRQVLRRDEFIDRGRGDVMVFGMALDPTGRLYVVVNQRNLDARPVANEVTIYRTTATVDKLPAAPKPWLRTSYPWGIGPYNHGVGHAAFGPDGMLYVSSGSRTDGNERGNDDRYWTGGEHDLTACLWRLDPSAADPKIEVFARGLRNPYGFCWDAKGRLFVTDNGPDADPAEELNLVERGKHYGFPYQFSDWTTKPYPHTPDAPPGLTFTRPVVNRGPAGGFDRTGGKVMSTFNPHSSPSGIACLGDDFPPPYRGCFLVARFGNLLPRDPDVGFDVLKVRLDEPAGDRPPTTATVQTFLSPVARPIDLHLGGRGRVYVCEYSRQLRNEGYAALLPGRVLEIAVKAEQ